MKEFVFGTREQFAQLDRLLSDGQCHVYRGCALPAGCTPQSTRLGFEKRDGAYAMYIDKGITCTAEHPGFARLLERGEAQFAGLGEMTAFLSSLRPLFPGGSSQEEEGPAVDKEELRRLREEENTPKMVRPEEISDRLKKNVFGQNEALDTLAKKVVINRMRKEKKLLTIGLLGPTGTGKSETGRSLAEILTELYGKEFGFIDIKTNQMVGEHSVHSFFGAPPGYVGHGKPTLLEPVRKNPNHVIVLEEIEKANQTVLTGLMEAIDTGILDMADNSPSIDLNGCIMILTSNISVDMEKYRAASAFARGEMCRDAFTRHCNRPEISGKIGNFLVFDHLPDEAMADVIVKFIRQELRSYDLRLNKVESRLMKEFISHQTNYGARPMMDLVSDAIGEQMLSGGKMDQLRGKRVSMEGTIDNIKFIVN